jgi:hypothetical protein
LKNLAEKCEQKAKDLNTKSTNIKTQFEKINEYNEKEDFIGFRPLLDKILEKLELPNEPTSLSACRGVPRVRSAHHPHIHIRIHVNHHRSVHEVRPYKKHFFLLHIPSKKYKFVPV